MQIFTDENAFTFEEEKPGNNGNHTGWDNPNNPHYQDVQAPLDDYAWILLLFAIIYFLLKAKKKI